MLMSDAMTNVAVLAPCSSGTELVARRAQMVEPSARWKRISCWFNPLSRRLWRRDTAVAFSSSSTKSVRGRPNSSELGRPSISAIFRFTKVVWPLRSKTHTPSCVVSTMSR